MLKTTHPDVDLVIAKLTDSLKNTLGSELRGLYLFGSLVGGDFDKEKSDIDILAIVKNVISDSQLEKLRQVHDQLVNEHPQWKDRIEVAYVSINGMKYFKTMTNKIARISPGEKLGFRSMDIDWLMDWHMVQEQGKIIFGPPPSTFIPSITNEEYIQSVRGIMREHAASVQYAKHMGYQSYIVLSCCRNLYAINHGKQVSKIAGARWAAEQYPQWANFINKAIKWRGMKNKSDSLETQKQTSEFTQFALEEAEKS